MKIEKGKVASINYTLTAPDGQVLDSSEGKEPLDYLHGAGNIIPGLEKALEGKKVGDSFEIDIPPEEAYGLREEARVDVVPKSQFEGIGEIQEGMQFQAQTNQGPVVVTVTKVEGDNITVDGNHPLAGMPLHFKVEVKEIREPSPEETEHGHVHGPEGHEGHDH